jgi:hypothetical protein
MAHFGLARETKFSLSFQHFSYLLFLLLLLGRVDQYIIKVSHSEFVNVRLQGIIDIGLQSRWCVVQPKRQDTELILPIPSVDRGVVVVGFFDSYKVIRVPEVQFRDDPGSSQSVYYLHHQWEWVSVLHSGFVGGSVVHTRPQSTVLLLCNQDWCCRSQRLSLDESIG